MLLTVDLLCYLLFLVLLGQLQPLRPGTLDTSGQCRAGTVCLILLGMPTIGWAFGLCYASTGLANRLVKTWATLEARKRSQIRFGVLVWVLVASFGVAGIVWMFSSILTNPHALKDLMDQDWATESAPSVFTPTLKEIEVAVLIRQIALTTNNDILLICNII